MPSLVHAPSETVAFRSAKGRPFAERKATDRTASPGAGIRRVWLLLPALLVLGCASKNTDEPIPIAHVGPLSGPAKTTGDHAQRGILLAVEEANREDQRIHGRRVAVVHGDDRGEPEAAQSEATRLITLNKPHAVLGGARPSEADRLARTAQSYGLPVVALSAIPASGSGEGILSLAVSAAHQGRILGRFTVDKLKPTRALVLADSRTSFSTDVAAAFLREFPKERPEEWNFKSDSEFPGLAKRLQKAAPQAVLIAASAQDFFKLAALIKELEPKVTLLYGGPEGEFPELLTDRETSQGVHLATTYLPESDAPANTDFVKKYRDRYQEVPDVSAAMAYDGLRLLLDAMRRARPLEPGEVRRELSRTEKFDSLTGPVTFKDSHAVRALYVVQLENGRTKLVEKYEPDAK